MFRAILAILISLPAAAQLIPVDTAIVVTVGPLIDDTDFKSLETTIAYNAAGMSVDLIKSSGTASAKVDLTLTTASTNDWTHLGNGVYEIEITAVQNDTEGNLQVVGVCDGVLPFFSPVYTVVPTAVYNSLALGSDNLQVDTIQVEGSDATDQINAEADTALADYDAPTNAEMVARTLVAASYFDPAADTVANVSTVATLSGHTPQTADHTASIAAILADTAAVDTASELQTLLMGSAVAPASTTQAATAQADLDLLTGANGATLATSQPNYAPATAAALSTAQSDITSILADTAAVDSTSEMRTFLTGADTPVAKDSSVTGLNNLSAAEVNAEVDTALADIHLDHLLATTYDPASKPGAADALLNELVENDGGVSRFTANALEQAPSGSGGDATAANQTTIITHLTDIKGATWSSSTDTLEAIANAIAALDVGGGSGDTLVNEDTGGTDALQVTDSSGNGIENVTILAYVASEFASNPATATVRATASTAADGRWESPYMMLDAGTTYTLYFYKQGVFGPATTNITP